jgi:Family of unknown function (DUF6134)
MENAMAASIRIALASVLVSVFAAKADETRTFRVWHDGKLVGYARMRLSGADGVTDCTTVVRVDERTTVGSYRYSFDGRETWRDGRTIELHSSAAEDGATFRLDFDALSGELQAKDKLRRVRGPVWPTTFAQLRPLGAVTLVDADSGRLTEGRLEKTGTETVRVAGKDVPSTRYRVTGERDVTLWYDVDDRLVRQSWIVVGTEMILELVECRHD